MRIAVLSDLHLEFVDFDPPAALRSADVPVRATDEVPASGGAAAGDAAGSVAAG